MAIAPNRFVLPVDDTLICGICGMVPHPSSAMQHRACDQMLCAPCLERALIDKKETPCPNAKCKQPIPGSSVCKSVIAENRVLYRLMCSFQVHCLHWKEHSAGSADPKAASASCQVTVQWEKLQSHLNDEERGCAFQPLPCVWCGTRVPRHALEQHQTACPKRKAKCPHCGQSVAVDDQKAHEERDCTMCSTTVIHCAFKRYGCPESYRRMDEDQHLSAQTANHLRMVVKANAEMEAKLTAMQTHMMQWEAKVEARFAADIKQALQSMQTKIDKMSEGVSHVVPSMCTAEGRGIKFAAVNTENAFTVIGKDRLGRKCEIAGSSAASGAGALGSTAGGTAAGSGGSVAVAHTHSGGAAAPDVLTAELTLIPAAVLAAAAANGAGMQSTMTVDDLKSVMPGASSLGTANASMLASVTANTAAAAVAQVPPVPVRVAISGGVYVCTYVPSVVGVYSLAVMLGGTHVQGSPFRVSVGPAGWLCHFGSAGTQPSRFTNPTGLAVDSRQDVVYCADSANHRVQVFSRDGQYLRKFGAYGTGDGQFNGPYCIAIDSANDLLYITDQNNHRIQVFRPDGTYVRQWGKPGTAPGQFAGPSGICLDAKCEFAYVTEFSGNRVQVFRAADGAFVRKWGSAGTGEGEFSIPYAIAVDARNDLCFVTDCNNNRIQVFRASDGKFVHRYGVLGSEDGRLSCPWILAFDSGLDLLYVTDCRNNRVCAFRYTQPTSQKPGGLVFVRKFGAEGPGFGQFASPSGIAVDPDTHAIFVADHNNHNVSVWAADTAR